MTNTLATTTTDIRQPHTHSKQIKLELIHKFYGDSLILQREWQHRCYWSCKYYVLSTCSGANFFFSIFIHLWQFTVAQSVGSSIDTLFFHHSYWVPTLWSQLLACGVAVRSVNEIAVCWGETRLNCIWLQRWSLVALCGRTRNWRDYYYFYIAK